MTFKVNKTVVGNSMLSIFSLWFFLFLPVQTSHLATLSFTVFPDFDFYTLPYLNELHVSKLAILILLK